MKLILTFCSIMIVASTYSQRKNTQTDFPVYSTIKIETQQEIINGLKVKTVISSGTGFFFIFKIPKGLVPVIVTNKHVLEGASKCFLYFKIKLIKDSLSDGYKNEKVVLANFSNFWMPHPDTSVDLAIIPIAPIIKEYNAKGFDFIRATYSEQDIPSDSLIKTLGAIEDIFMVGYPFGLRDISNDMPIVRKGITATPAHLNYNSKKEFLCDIPVYPGSSGSPILIFNNGSYGTQEGISFGSRLLLLGVNYATYTRNFEGKLTPKASYNLEDSLRVNVPIPYNIGIVIKSQRILDFKTYFK